MSDGKWNKSAAGTADTKSLAAEIPIEMLSQLDSAYWGVGGTVVMSPSFYQAMRAVTDNEGRYLWPELANRHPSAEGTFMWQGMRTALDPHYAGHRPRNGRNQQGSGHHRRSQGLRDSEHRGDEAVEESLGPADIADAVRFVLHCYTDSNAIHPWGLRLIRATVQA